jgi:hypothetical protein
MVYHAVIFGSYPAWFSNPIFSNSSACPISPMAPHIICFSPSKVSFRHDRNMI